MINKNKLYDGKAHDFTQENRKKGISFEIYPEKFNKELKQYIIIR